MYIQNKIEGLLKSKIAVENNGIIELDIEKIGCDKLTSKGPVSIKLSIIAKSATPGAIKAIEDAGGKVTLPEQTAESSDADDSGKEDSEQFDGKPEDSDKDFDESSDDDSDSESKD